MRTPTRPDHIPPTDALHDVAAGGCFYPEDDLALWMATDTTQSSRHVARYPVGDPPVVQQINTSEVHRQCVRLHDGRVEFLDVRLPVRPVEHEAREVVNDDR
jgi:hypothetical protein